MEKSHLVVSKSGSPHSIRSCSSVAVNSVPVVDCFRVSLRASSRCLMFW